MESKQAELTEALKGEAQRLGFALSGVCPAVTPQGISRFREWLAAGYGGTMHYLRDRADAYEDPNRVLDGVRCILMLGLPYRNQPAREPESGQGRVSKYAWGTTDYHDLIHGRLRQLRSWLTERVPNAKVRGVVDTAPLLEREFAQLAGLGWVGKNTLLLNKKWGSWFFLAALLTDVELMYDEPHQTDHCGTCRACLDACPTDAFPQPYVLDATKCISYLTIELRKMPGPELRPGMGDWLFGCDICQDVCPWGQRAAASEPDFLPQADMNPIELRSLFLLSDDDFRRQFRHTPLWRPKRRGILRNAAIVLGNHRSTDAIPELTAGLQDKEPLVRQACAWALGQVGGPKSLETLQQQASHEDDDAVRVEMERAIAAASRG